MREHLKEPRRPPKIQKIEKERGSNTTILFTKLVPVAPTLHYREFSWSADFWCPGSPAPGF